MAANKSYAERYFEEVNDRRDKLQLAYNGICGVVHNLNAAGETQLALVTDSIRALIGHLAFPETADKCPGVES